jgi:putative radical SAM enzyme (TIGR03279 family)
MKVTAVHPDSPLFGYVRPNHTLISINGQPVQDDIDFRFRIADETVELVFETAGGERLVFNINFSSGDEAGLTFEEPPIKTCNCNCIFCFVHQQPKGMRKALYVKDEDYRLSFTHGNFVTLSNATDDDLKRMVAQRLSPLYISVHATDDSLRRSMLRNEKLAPILPRLRYLADNGIQLHTQVVLCPGINDGVHLNQTIKELALLYPGVQSLAVVPVGLTRYRERLPRLRPYTSAEATEIINEVETSQLIYRESLGTRLVWAADEFYIQAGRDFPSQSSYEEMPQFENGVGMVREFVTRFNRRRSRLRNVKSRRTALFLTGHSAFPFWRSHLLPYLQKKLRLRIRVEPTENRFWGETVTVSGLLTGQDLLHAVRSCGKDADVIVLPPNCLNRDDLFLDNLSLEQFRQTLDKAVVVGSYDLYRTVREVFV